MCFMEREAQERKMMKNRRVLVPLKVPDGMVLCPALVDMLSSMEVILLGFCLVPKQTDPEQARDRFEEESKQAMDDLEDELKNSGAKVTSRLVFTHNRMESIERVADEEDCRVLLIPGEEETCSRILVPIRSEDRLGEIAGVGSDLLEDQRRSVTLLYIAEDEDDAKKGDSLLRDAKGRIEEELTGEASADLKVIISDDEAGEVDEESLGHDVMLAVEEKPSLAKMIKGDLEIETEKSRQTLVILRKD